MREAPSSTGEALRRDQKLRDSPDYLRCYRQGRRRHGSFVILYVHANALATPRLGITASRKVGPATVRNRSKRRIREIFRRWPRRAQLPAVDLVCHLKNEAGKAPFAALRTDLETLMAQLLASR